MKCFIDSHNSWKRCNTTENMSLHDSCSTTGTKHLKKVESTQPTARAFICFSVSGTLDEALAVVFDILLEGPLHSRMETA